MKKISAQTVIHKLQNALFQINMEKVNNLLDKIRKDWMGKLQKEKSK